MGETGGKKTRVKAMGVRETGGKVSGKGGILMGDREIDNSLPCDKAARQNVTEWTNGRAILR